MIAQGSVKPSTAKKGIGHLFKRMSTTSTLQGKAKSQKPRYKKSIIQWHNLRTCERKQISKEATLATMATTTQKWVRNTTRPNPEGTRHALQVEVKINDAYFRTTAARGRLCSLSISMSVSNVPTHVRTTIIHSNARRHNLP